MAMLTVGITSNLANGLGVPSRSLGILISVYTLTFAISGPIINTVLNKVHDQPVIITSFIIFTLGNLLAFFSKNLSMLVVSRLVTAIGAATLVVRLLNQAAIITHSGSILTTVYMGFSLANAIGLPLSTFAGEYLNWRYIFLIISVLSAIVTIIFGIDSDKLILTDNIAVTKKNNQALGQENTDESLKFISIIIITMLVLAANASFIAYLSPFSNKIGYSNRYLTISMLILGIGSLVGSKIGGSLGDKKKPQIFYQMALILFLGSAILMLCVARVNLIIFWIILFLWNATQWITGPLGVMLITKLTNKYRNTALSFNTTAQNLGASLGSFAGQMFLNTAAIQYLPIVSILFLGIALIILNASKLKLNQ
ncbi:hypothetical protein FC64_GL001257 [Ligilactobacillus araffinosus DSM 20653]|uniref:Major facilitator superfamily (MFS) profile domain-containing protein n=2 Tax=Ligilactobacillus araffinosus TaxID=147809 RepID=A0A0R1ZJG0_9LACO|nr:hypothetical protein FC64_GL001257 [Ligilactobacillus araffinosus DSM 20653]